MADRKCKRYNGRPYNVRNNIFFESYMKTVAEGMIYYKLWGN